MTKPLPAPPAAEAGWAYFLDFDGTLVQIASRPEDVIVTDRLRYLLRSVHQETGGALAVVTGRSLTDLDSLLASPDLPAAGVHGLEIRGCLGANIVGADTALLTGLAAVRDCAADLKAVNAGIRVEDKGRAVAIHFRSAPEMEQIILPRVNDVVRPFAGALSVLHGKMVIEVKPAEASKARAVELFLQDPAFAGRRPCFVGDDVTDEDGFRACNARGGVSIQVGGGKAETAARFQLESPTCVRDWLSHLITPQQKVAR